MISWSLRARNELRHEDQRVEELPVGHVVAMNRRVVFHLQLPKRDIPGQVLHPWRVTERFSPMTFRASFGMIDVRCVGSYPLGKYSISIESACELSRTWYMFTVIIASRSTPVSSMAVIFGSFAFPFLTARRG